MKKVIICIHGLGNKPSKELLNEWWKEAIIEGLRLRGINKKLPLLEIVYWADILYDKPLNSLLKDDKDPLFLDEPYQPEPENIEIEDNQYKQKVADFITDKLNKLFLNEDKSLNYGSITDYILKKYFHDLEEYYLDQPRILPYGKRLVREIIRERLADVIRKYNNHEILIVAHSMGSIIAFDVLTFLLPNAHVKTFVTIGSPLGLPIIIGKIAEEQKNFSKENTLIKTPPSITESWYNFADIRDHVALNYKLADDFIPNQNGVIAKDFLVNNNYQANGIKNPHKSYGYLRTPQFSQVISDFIGEEKRNLGQIALDKVNEYIIRIKEFLKK